MKYESSTDEWKRVQSIKSTKERMDATEKLKRCRMFVISERDMLDILVGNATINAAPLPSDAYLSGAWYHFQSNSWHIRVQSQTFDLVPEGQEIPLANDPFMPVKAVR